MTATLASWIVERVSEAKDEANAVQGDLQALRKEVAQLRGLMLRDNPAGAEPPTKTP